MPVKIKKTGDNSVKGVASLFLLKRAVIHSPHTKLHRLMSAYSVGLGRLCLIGPLALRHVKKPERMSAATHVGIIAHAIIHLMVQGMVATVLKVTRGTPTFQMVAKILMSA